MNGGEEEAEIDFDRTSGVCVNVLVRMIGVEMSCIGVCVGW